MYFQVKKSNEETELDSFKTFPRLYLFIFKMLIVCYGFPGGSVVKNPSADAGDIGDAGSIPGLGRPTERGNGNPLQYFCLDNLLNRGAWWSLVHGVAKSPTRLSNFTCLSGATCTCCCLERKRPLDHLRVPNQIW